jgi:tRNA(Ile)-lysidine synthase
MLKKFLAFSAEQKLFNPDDPILLAVSGGMDSVVMAHLFFKAKLRFGIAHCNFGLRGEEADADELFVKKLAKKYKAPYFSNQFETQAFADSEKISVQMAARVLRYTWLEQVRMQQSYQALATAHHVNDMLETIFFNVTRGTGISGLHGILPGQNHLIRPLLFASKEDIYDYVVEHQLAWREDSSNQSVKYQRNLIRNEVVPLLKNINPNLENTIRQTVEKVSAVERIFDRYVSKLRQKAFRHETGAGFLSIKNLQEEPEMAIVLSELLKPYHFSYAQSKEILQVLDGEAGRKFESPTHILVKDRSELVITAKPLQPFMSADLEEEQTDFEHELFSLQLKKLRREAVQISSRKNLALLDYATLRFPLKIRKWKEGDWFIPLGMNKKKKLSDFLIDEKIPLNLKDRIWVLTSNDAIAWVIGQRIDDRFKITENTEDVLQIQMQAL